MHYHPNSDTKHNYKNNMIDTLKYSEKFKKAGFDSNQAKMLAHSFAETVEQVITKNNENELAIKNNSKKLDKDLLEIKLKLKDIDLKIEQTKGGLSKEMEKIKGNLSKEIEQTKSNLLKWMISMFTGQAAIIIAAFFTITKL